MKLRPGIIVQLRHLSLALLAFMLVQLFVQTYDRILQSNRRENQVMATRITAEQVVLRLEAGLDARLDRLQRLGAMRSGMLTDEGSFKQYAEQILQQFPDFKAINWVDADMVIRVTVPAAGNEGALGRNLRQHPDPSVQKAIQRSLTDGRMHRSTVVHLLQGGQGFACYLRVVDASGNLLGMINGVFRVDHLLDACLPEERLRRQYNISMVTETGNVIYECHRDRTLIAGIQPVKLPVTVVDPGWSFLMLPTRAHLADLSSPLDYILPWIAHVLSLFTAVVVWKFLRWREETRDVERRYRELFRGSLDGVFIVDRNNRLIEANSACLAIFGYTRGEVLGQPLMRLNTNREQLQRLQRILLSSGVLSREEVTFRRRDGREARCLISATLRRDERGNTDGAQGIISDVTEHALTVEQLRQAQKMEAIGHLAGGVAHDFNNLLTVISGNSELAMMHLGEDNPARVELKEIRRTAGRAANLTRQLLAFSRKQVIRPRLLCANDTLHDMERMLKRIIGETISFTSELNPAAWTIKVDPAQLEQVIVNLVVNARDAMEKGGEICVRTCNEVLGEIVAGCDAPPGEYLVIEVSDTGCGMSAEVVEHIFEPFYTTKPEGVGTGLGLATVYGIVKQSEGFINVKSRTGEGTTFRVLLPRQADMIVVEQVRTVKEIQRGTETLLVVEDEPAVRRMTVDSLKRQGYIVHEADNGRVALDLARQLGPSIDLVVSDVVMPEMGGVEFVTELRHFMPRLPVLFLSGYSEEAIRRQGELQSDAKLLQKPFDLHELHLHVRDLLTRKAV